MTSWLLKLGVGGVQEQIAQARKLRDLAAGSTLVSGAIAAALGRVPRLDGVTPLLPTTPSARGTARGDAPNQVVLRVQGDEQAVQATAQELEGAIRDFFDQAWEAAAKAGPGVANARQREPEAVARQIKTAVDLCWVAVPETGDYRADFKSLQKAWDARRLSRTFGQLKPLTKAGNWTCSLCGQRAAVLTSGPRSERLCAPCARKRHWDGGQRFVSTHVLGHRRFFTDSPFDDARRSLAGYGCDETCQQQLLDDVDDDRLDDALRRLDSADWNQARPQLEGLQQQLGKLSAYYAVIALDGDHMGRRLAGEKLPDGESLEAYQGTLSRALGEFAAGLRERGTDLNATTVYAGGDDALVFAPLDALLPLLTGAYAAWAQALAAVPPPAPTLSAYATVVHAKQPLQPVLHSLRHGLHTAKDLMARDCVAVAVTRHAGSAIEMHARWAELDRLVAAVEAFSDWRAGDRGRRPETEELDRRRREALPQRLLYTLARQLGPFFNGAGDLALGRGTLAREVARLAGRSAAAQEPWAPIGDWLLARASNPGSKPDSVRRVGPPSWPAVWSALMTVAALARELSYRGGDGGSP